MKSVNKIIAVLVMSMGLVSGLYCENRKLVATKTSNTSSSSYIEIWQGGSQPVSAAKFTKSTASKGTQYPKGQLEENLFFDTEKGNVEVRFYWSADADGIGGAFGVVPYRENYTVSDLPFGTTIKIDCASGTNSCKKITVVKPNPKFARVKVVKAAAPDVQWTVKALKRTIAESNLGKDNPGASQIYSTVNVMAETGLMNKLKVPTNQDFWILVSSNDKKDKILHTPRISDKIKAGTVTSNSVIDIDETGKATVRNK